MIKYRKELSGELYFHSENVKKNEKLKIIGFKHEDSDNFEHAIQFDLPCGEKIILDANFLKIACEKVIALNRI